MTRFLDLDPLQPLAMTVFNVYGAGSDPRAQYLFQIGSHGHGSFPGSSHKNSIEAGERIGPFPGVEEVLTKGNVRGKNLVGVCGENRLEKDLFRVSSEFFQGSFQRNLPISILLRSRADLFHRYTFGQISRLIYIRPLENSDIIRQQLEGNR